MRTGTAIVELARARLAIAWGGRLSRDITGLHDALSTELWYVDPPRGTCRRLAASANDPTGIESLDDGWEHFDGAGHVDLVWRGQRALALWDGLHASTRACGPLRDPSPVIVLPLPSARVPAVIYVRLPRDMRDVLRDRAAELVASVPGLLAGLGSATAECLSRYAEPPAAHTLRDLIGDRTGSPAVVGVAYFDGARDPRVELNLRWLSSRQASGLQRVVFEGSHSHEVARWISGDLTDEWRAHGFRVGLIENPPPPAASMSLSTSCLVVEAASSGRQVRIILPFRATEADVDAATALPLSGFQALRAALDCIWRIEAPTEQTAALRTLMKSVLWAAAGQDDIRARGASTLPALEALCAVDVSAAADDLAGLRDALGACSAQAWATPLAHRLRADGGDALFELTRHGVRRLPRDRESRDPMVAAHSAWRHAAALGLFVSKLGEYEACPLSDRSGYATARTGDLLHIFGPVADFAEYRTICTHPIEGGRLLLATPLEGSAALDLARRLAQGDEAPPIGGRHIFSRWGWSPKTLELVAHTILDPAAFTAREAESLASSSRAVVPTRPLRVALRHVRREGRVLPGFSRAAGAAMRGDPIEAEVQATLAKLYADDAADMDDAAPAELSRWLRPAMAGTLTALALHAAPAPGQGVPSLPGMARSMYIAPVAPAGMVVAFSAGEAPLGAETFRRGSTERRRVDDLARALSSRPRTPVLALVDGEPRWFRRPLKLPPNLTTVLTRLLKHAGDPRGVDLGDRDPKAAVSKLRLSIAEQAAETELREVAALLGVLLPSRALIPVDRRTCVAGLFVKVNPIETTAQLGIHRYRIALPIDRLTASD